MDVDIQPLADVAELVAPRSFADFYKEYWGKSFAYLPATEGMRARVQKTFSLQDFLAAVYEAEIRDSRLQVVLDGRVVSEHENKFVTEKMIWDGVPNRESLERACSGKSTMIFNRIERSVPKLADFCAGSMRVLGEGVNINAYFSPSGGGLGIGSHYDIQEAFILQVYGSKVFRNHHEIYKNPIRRIDLSKSSEERQPNTGTYSDIMMTPGDVLYLPRGQWHFPMLHNSEPSLHLTITIPCSPKYSALSTWLADCLKQDQQLHEFLPLILEESSSHADFIEAMESLRGRALEVLADPDFGRNVLMHKFRESFSRTADYTNEN